MYIYLYIYLYIYFLLFSSDKGLKSISHYTSESQKRDLRNVLKLILDDNQLSSLEGVELFDKLIQVTINK